MIFSLSLIQRLWLWTSHLALMWTVTGLVIGSVRLLHVFPPLSGYVSHSVFQGPTGLNNKVEYFVFRVPGGGYTYFQGQEFQGPYFQGSKCKALLFQVIVFPRVNISKGDYFQVDWFARVWICKVLLFPRPYFQGPTSKPQFPRPNLQAPISKAKFASPKFWTLTLKALQSRDGDNVEFY